MMFYNVCIVIALDFTNTFFALNSEETYFSRDFEQSVNP